MQPSEIIARALDSVDRYLDATPAHESNHFQSGRIAIRSVLTDLSQLGGFMDDPSAPLPGWECATPVFDALLREIDRDPS